MAGERSKGNVRSGGQVVSGRQVRVAHLYCPCSDRRDVFLVQTRPWWLVVTGAVVISQETDYVCMRTSGKENTQSAGRWTRRSVAEGQLLVKALVQKSDGRREQLRRTNERWGCTFVWTSTTCRGWEETSLPCPLCISWLCRNELTSEADRLGLKVPFSQTSSEGGILMHYAVRYCTDPATAERRRVFLVPRRARPIFDFLTRLPNPPSAKLAARVPPPALPLASLRVYRIVCLSPLVIHDAEPTRPLLLLARRPRPDSESFSADQSTVSAAPRVKLAGCQPYPQSECPAPHLPVSTSTRFSTWRGKYPPTDEFGSVNDTKKTEKHFHTHHTR